jgi:hypothetical protein
MACEHSLLLKNLLMSNCMLKMPVPRSYALTLFSRGHSAKKKKKTRLPRQPQCLSQASHVVHAYSSRVHRCEECHHPAYACRSSRNSGAAPLALPAPPPVVHDDVQRI